MKTTIYILILLVSISTSASAQLPKPDQSDRIADSQAIRKLINEIGVGFVSRDYEPFERIYTENYISIRNRPIYNYREQLVAMMKADSAAIKAGKKLDYVTLSYDNENPQIRFFGQTAIVNVFKRNNWRYRDVKCLSRNQATEVWLKLGGAWKLVAGHVTAFPCDPMPWHPIHPAVADIPTRTEPRVAPDKEAASLVRGFVSGVAEMAPRSDALDRVFAANFVSTNTKGNVDQDRTPLIAALKTETGTVGRPREGEAVQVIGDTAIYTFRKTIQEKIGQRESRAVLQITIVLVNFEGRWQIAASHISKSTG